MFTVLKKSMAGVGPSSWLTFGLEIQRLSALVNVHGPWPFDRPIYGPLSPPSVAPDNDVGLHGLIRNLASLLAGTATNPFGNGYLQGRKEAPLEAASACPGVYGQGAYPGYNAHGVNGKKHPSCCYLHIRNSSLLKRMKQKIVIRVSAHCDRCRAKAMKLAAAAAADGVSSVALEGDYKDKLVVMGEGVDAAELTRILGKKVNYATLESVQEVKREPTPIPPCCPSRCGLYQVAYDPYPTNTCTIM